MPLSSPLSGVASASLCLLLLMLWVIALSSGLKGVVQILQKGLALTPGLARGLVMAVALAVLATVGRIVVPIVVQLFIDTAVMRGDVHLALRLGAVGIVIVLATLAVTYVMNILLFRVGETALARLRVKVFSHIHSMSLIHQRRNRRGGLVSRVTGDIDAISQFLQWGGILLLLSFCQLALATAVMVAYSWELAAVVLLCFAPLMWIVPQLHRRLSEVAMQVRLKSGTLMALLAESVVGATIIRTYGAGKAMGQRIDVASHAVRKAQTKAQRLTVFASSAGEIAAGLAGAGLVAVGAWLGVGGRLSLGELTAFFFLLTLFVAPAQFSTEFLGEAQSAAAGYRRVLEILDTPPDIVESSAPRDLPAGPLSVTYRSVSFAYPDGPHVLHDISIHIAAQSRVAVVGETGSGKSTFANLLMRLVDPTTGQILVSGVPLQEVSFSQLRRRIAIVPQDGFLFNGTIGENVRLARPEASDMDIKQSFKELHLADWLAALPDGLSTHVGERGEAISVGERQLVALARAQLGRPDLLILDEATSAVDPGTERRVAAALEALSAECTTITIAHRLASVEAADDILVLESGRLVQQGRHSVLMTEEEGPYAQLQRAARSVVT